MREEALDVEFGEEQERKVMMRMSSLKMQRRRSRSTCTHKGLREINREGKDHDELKGALLELTQRS